MAGVGAAVEAHNDIVVAPEKVHDLALGLIAPLESHDAAVHDKIRCPAWVTVPTAQQVDYPPERPAASRASGVRLPCF
jgi:hypothetical protein